MLSLQDCIAMADIPEEKLLELAGREHLPMILAVALAAQRGREVAPSTQNDSLSRAATDIAPEAADPCRPASTSKACLLD